jgi:hypothetical protein
LSIGVSIAICLICMFISIQTILIRIAIIYAIRGRNVYLIQIILIHNFYIGIIFMINKRLSALMGSEKSPSLST